MLTPKKKILEIENRINELEKEFNTLLLSLSGSQAATSDTLSYEEVIDLWLNGKVQA